MAFRDGILVFRQAGALPEPALAQVIDAVRDLDMDEVRARLLRRRRHRMTAVGEVAGATYAIAVTVDRPFGETLAATRESLAAQGFGVLTEIDMQATLKAKLGVDIVPQ